MNALAADWRWRSLSSALLPLSSNFCLIAVRRRTQYAAFACIGFFTLCCTPGVAEVTTERFADVVSVVGSEFGLFDGCAVDRLGLLACRDNRGRETCDSVPFQIDEVDAEGHWVLDQGPQPNADGPPGVLYANDRVLFMASDAGDRVGRVDLPPDTTATEISVRDPLTGDTHWAYLLAYRDRAPRSARWYVSYDSATDRVRGQRVTLGFRHGVPGYLAVDDSPMADGTAATSLLDRFKVRATATFLWGLIRFSRNEDDVSSEFVAWRQGPIRVIRRQRQWVRIGWGIHSPTFGSYTYFYRDFAELPVSLYLNFPPTYFFGDITIRAFLDFRDLRNWSVLLPDLSEPIAVDGAMTTQKKELNQLPGSWFALRGPHVTLLQILDVGSSLASVRRSLVYNETSTQHDPPEEVPGEEPAIGYRLDRWEHVGAGAHQLASTSYALPPDLDVRQFMAARRVPLAVTVRPLP